MSYTDGIGNLQQIISSLATPETRASQTNSTQETATTTPATSPSAAPTAQKADQASLSATSSVISQALSSDSDVRTEKVAALQQAIAAGSYNVSSSDVADKLIQSLLK